MRLSHFIDDILPLGAIALIAQGFEFGRKLLEGGAFLGIGRAILFGRSGRTELRKAPRTRRAAATSHAPCPLHRRHPAPWRHRAHRPGLRVWPQAPRGRRVPWHRARDIVWSV